MQTKRERDGNLHRSIQRCRIFKTRLRSGFRGVDSARERGFWAGGRAGGREGERDVPGKDLVAAEGLLDKVIGPCVEAAEDAELVRIG